MTLLIAGRRSLLARVSDRSSNGGVLAPALAGGADTTDGYT
ncbi:MAG: hypothetical protein VYA18_16705 [Pseudomonadota bacterium]|nr:hypothetical protein [Pseudomonadota bacterium]